LSRSGAPVKIDRQAFNLLTYLIEERGRFITRAAIFEKLWAGNDKLYDSALYTCLSATRRAIGDVDRTIIETVRRVGMRFTADVEDLSPRLAPEAHIIRQAFDFVGRERDLERLSALQARLGGWYEAYHYAMSRDDHQDVSVCLLRIAALDSEQAAIHCEISDRNFKKPYFFDQGHLLLIADFLYFLFVAKEQDALSFYCFRRPTGSDPGQALFGILLGLSGGVDGAPRRCPAAVRVVLRPIGHSAEEALGNSILKLEPNGFVDPEETLQANLGGYLSDLKASGLLRSDREAVIGGLLQHVGNAIVSDAVPLALLMPNPGER
jgi:DNA-binding winged helix-turn-helix (wHTH) protein